MAAYAAKYGNAEVLLLEPERDDYLMFFTNIFGFSERRAVCEHAYRTTRRHLLARFDELAAVFARHGVTLRRDVLEEERDLWEMVGAPHAAEEEPPPRRSSPAVVHRLDDALRRIERRLA
jgi:hypothetical protein